MAARKPAKRRQSAKRRRTGGRAKAKSAPKTKTTKRVKSSRRAAAGRRRPAARANKKASVKRSAARGPRKVRGRRAQPVAARPKPAPAANPVPRVRRPVSRVLLDRERRLLPESERAEPLKPEPDERLIAAARTGHDELQQSLLDHTETGPELTAGDVDAKWEDAYAVGDEAPGGDNPTPDQDRVDDIGRALGVEYADNEELKADKKISERDRHRWELDPASSEDWPHQDKKDEK